MASVALGFAGKAIGTAFGGPLGGMIGGAIGSALGGLIDNQLFPMKTEGPRLSDLTIQSSAYGAAIPLIYGGDNRMAGNVIWSSGLIETAKKTKQGGKGGPSVQTTEYTYRTSTAVLLGAGILSRVKKVWANNKVIFDVDGVEDGTGLFSALRFYPGTQTQMPDPSIEADLGMGNAPAYRGSAYIVIADFQLADYGNRLPNLEFLVEADADETVGSACRDIIVRCGIDPNTVSFGGLGANQLRGMVVANAATGDAALQPLALAFDFDLSDQGGGLRFTKRGAAPAGFIPIDDLGGSEPDNRPADPLRWSRQVETMLPRQATVTFADPERDFQPNSQGDSREGGSAENNLETQLAITLSADEGRATASRLLWEAWNSRQGATGSLTDRWRNLVPGRVYLVETPAGLEPLRIKHRSRGVNGVIEFEAVRDRLEVYASTTAGAPASVPPNEPTVIGPVRVLLLDIPLLLDADDLNAEGFYFGAFAESGGWRGAQILRALEETGTYVSMGTQSFELTNGDTLNDVEAIPPGFDVDTDWDDATEIRVDLRRDSFSLESLTDAEVLAGGNAAYVGPASGYGGEIIQFADANQELDGSWTLTRLRRGQKGTEAEGGAPGTSGDGPAHGVGSLFVLLEPGVLQRANFGLADLNLERAYKGVGLYGSQEDADATLFTNTGVGLRPYAPTQLAVTGPSGGDLGLDWVRRSRVGWPAIQPPPLTEETEAYTLEILASPGGAVVRTEALTSPSFVYTAAMQTADFGAPVTSLAWRVAQVSAIYGDGAFAESSGPV
jgi:hypothetical protein